MTEKTSLADSIKAKLKNNPEQAPETEGTQTSEEEAMTALDSIANSLYHMEKHLMALVYLQRVNTPENGLTFVNEVFMNIYTDEDPEKIFAAPEMKPEEKKT